MLERKDQWLLFCFDFFLIDWFIDWWLWLWVSRTIMREAQSPCTSLPPLISSVNSLYIRVAHLLQEYPISAHYHSNVPHFPQSSIQGYTFLYGFWPTFYAVHVSTMVVPCRTVSASWQSWYSTIHCRTHIPGAWPSPPVYSAPSFIFPWGTWNSATGSSRRLNLLG